VKPRRQSYTKNDEWLATYNEFEKLINKMVPSTATKDEQLPIPTEVQGKKYTIPKGVEILVHRTQRLKTLAPMSATGADFICVTTVKETIYDIQDLCMFEGVCELGYGMRNSHFYVDGNYYGFRLPPNDMGAEFFIIYKEWIK